MTPTDDERRAALERELRERLARDEGSVPALPLVALLCLKCRGICTSDAHFCKYCGTRFNVLVVARPDAPGESV